MPFGLSSATKNCKRPCNSYCIVASGKNKMPKGEGETKMTKRQYQIDAFQIKTNRGNHIVTLEHLKNDRNGNPRYKAVIIFTEEETKEYYNAVYSFTGHYLGRFEEAKWIVNYYEKEIYADMK